MSWLVPAANWSFLLNLPHFDGEDLSPRPLIERKAKLQMLLADARSPLAGR
jgi:ATP-dependent DNA ligase